MKLQGTKNNNIMAYVDGFMYTRDVLKCAHCNNETNRIDVSNNKTICTECEKIGD